MYIHLIEYGSGLAVLCKVCFKSSSLIQYGSWLPKMFFSLCLQKNAKTPKACLYHNRLVSSSKRGSQLAPWQHTQRGFLPVSYHAQNQTDFFISLCLCPHLSLAEMQGNESQSKWMAHRVLSPYFILNTTFQNRGFIELASFSQVFCYLALIPQLAVTILFLKSGFFFYFSKILITINSQ